MPDATPPKASTDVLAAGPPGAAAAVRTTCPYCGVGCGVRAATTADGATAIDGDPAHPANRGRLCAKGLALADTLGPEERLLHPMVRGRRVDWPTAIGAVATAFRETIAAHGPDSVALYVSGQLLTEDYYVANKLAKGFLGTANVDTNSRLCMASAVAGHRRAFGEDTVPGCYEDIEQADMVVLVGSNLAWCHPVLHQRLVAARAARGTRVVVVDPRRTSTVDAADMHLKLRPGTDHILFAGLLSHLVVSRAADRDWIARHTSGFGDALAAALRMAPSAERVAERCDLDREDVAGFFRDFAGTGRVVTVWSQGVNQSTRGTDTVDAIINCHIATGRIGRPGMGPFSVTGQPNAMGGREVGGLANQLAAHMAFEDPAAVDRVRRFWDAPAMATRPGLKAVDLFGAIADGRVKAVWIMGTNPAVSLPDGAMVRAALAACPFVAVSDCVHPTDTGRFAHVLLPAAGWSEKDGTVTNSERTISRQRAFRAAPGEARPDWWIVTEVARALGHGHAFAYRRPADIFREHAALSAFENGGARAFDIGALAGLADAAYDALEPVQWPVRADGTGTARLHGDGRFSTADGRARFVPTLDLPPPRATDGDFPLLLNSGRSRDQWHTMTRTGRSARLSAHAPEPVLTMAPQDAAASGVGEGMLAEVESAAGRAVARVALSDAQRPGEVFLPIHWSERFAAGAGTGRLYDGRVDPVSGQPDLKRMPVAVRPWAALWAGLLLTREPATPAAADWWARRRAAHCHVLSLAGRTFPGDWTAWPQSLAGVGLRAPDIELVDRARGTGRWAWFEDGRLVACLAVARAGVPLPPADWLAACFGEASIDDATRAILLAGRPAMGAPAEGRLICTCFGVGAVRIEAAVRGGCETAKAVGASLGAGTNCGSCLSEIREIIGHVRARDAA